MADSTVNTLSFDYTSIRRRLADYMGYGLSSSDWTGNRETYLDDIMQAGQHMAYYPPRVPTMTTPHEWSFLRPFFVFKTTENQVDYEMPHTFDGRLIGHPMMRETSTDTWDVVMPYTPRQLQDQKIGMVTSGRPVACAVSPVVGDGSGPQRWSMEIFPTPDGEYEVKAQFQAQIPLLSSTRPYPLGPSSFGYLVMLACLAAAEQQIEDMPGPKLQEFLVQLESEIAKDLRTLPENLGPGWKWEGSDYPMTRRQARQAYGLINGTLLWNGESV